MRKKLSQKEVAAQIGVAPSTYRDWEYGKKIVGEPYAELATTLGISLSELLTGKQNNRSDLLGYVDELDRLVNLIRKTVASF